MNIYWLIYFFFLHWMGDFGTQFRFVADNKGKSVWVLLLHVLMYGVVLGLGTMFIVPTSTPLYKDPWMIWLGVNCLLHLLIDAMTSRYTSRLYAAGNMYGFFSLVGFDQFLHTASILVTTRIFLT